ncbi:hypothetical protein NEUTE1DRAFT_119066 [Neurospora tetrasperma FGSC 2508]|uniref:Uncharacterized protein n=1 Tax=Neurospora tetrasperma (strain FGSC 2508 / ATCC MYA-4615 / P0657) TaxID=510951 RepID=F8N160_NEUT8|nr:uncharacterized protein NEUTE1DRAFT_119066 [Neurospora tetrasperma FGSC 2508]EGO53093.1 hypothetical protein NEUTE1DRAFT_119066 [Neurospora tetrasperma FGSC 2508]
MPIHRKSIHGTHCDGSSSPLVTSSFVVQAKDNYSVPRYYSGLPCTHAVVYIPTVLHTKHAR